MFDFSSLEMANIGELPYGVLGTAPKFGLREEIEFVPVLTSSKQRRKRKFNVVFVQVVKKSPLLVIYLLGSFRLTLSLLSPSPSPSRRCSEDLSMCVRNPNTFLEKNACHLFTRYICYCWFGPLMNYFVSVETEIWVENKKKSIVLEKI